MTEYRTPENVKQHADAMNEIERIATRFSAAEATIILAGALGNILCRVKGPSTPAGIITAKMFAGIAFAATYDMINRHFPEDGK